MTGSIITLQDLINAQADAQSLEEVVNGEPNKRVETRLGRQLWTLATLPYLSVYTQEEINSKLLIKADKDFVEASLNTKVEKTYVDTALSSFQNGAIKAYPTLAAANADIANIALNTKVSVLSATEGGDYYKASSSATSLTKSPYDIQALILKDPQISRTGMWFYPPYIEMSNDILYIKLNTYSTTDNAFYVRQSHLLSNTQYTKTDIMAQLQASSASNASFGVTSPNGQADCFTLTGTMAIYFNVDTQKFTIEGRNADANKRKVLIIGNDDGKMIHGIQADYAYYKVCQQQLTSSVTELKQPLYMRDGIFLHKPIFEYSNSILYLSLSEYASNPSTTLFCRDSKYGHFNISKSDLLTSLLANIQTTNVKTGVTSPNGLTDCISFENTGGLYFNPTTKTFYGRNRAASFGENLNLICIIGNDSGGSRFDGLEASTVKFQLLVKNTNLTPEGIWLYNAQYEASGNSLYIKLNAHSSGNTLYSRGRFGNFAMTTAEFLASVASNNTYPDGITTGVTSPSGLTNCIKLQGTATLYFDPRTKTVYAKDRAYSPDLLTLIGNDDCLIYHGIEAYRAYTQTKAALYVKNPTGVVQNYLDDFVKAVNHRGYSNVAPENTLPAYRLSKKMGYSYVECDISFTSDNVAMLLHDDTIDRTSNGTGQLSSMTYEQVRQYDFGAWRGSTYSGTKIPTLFEFLTLCRKLSLHPYVEIKSSSNLTTAKAKIIADVIKSSHMLNKLTIISFSSDALALMAVQLPKARLGYVVDYINTSTINTAVSLNNGTNEVFLDANTSNVTEALVTQAQQASLDVECWTVGSSSDLTTKVAYGVTGITTNDLNVREILNASEGI